jgi:hypothetical protein
MLLMGPGNKKEIYGIECRLPDGSFVLAEGAANPASGDHPGKA